MEHSNKIKVWDPLVRFFHWSLVAAFLIAYLTEEELLLAHTWAGYMVLALVLIRVVWGFVGTQYARFSDFLYKPATIIQFLKDTMSLKAKRYFGHNPAGGAMVVVLLVILIATAGSGILLLGAEDQSGPAATFFEQNRYFWAEILEELHEFFANFSILLVVVHIAGVLVESLIHGENLVSAMLTGLKPRK
ncbi:MAG: cytochrome B [Gammaproteobacteria bacterium]|nr:cytochrome b/b6 domain-containing protein [Gammaproteobacteria bacterium]NNJ90394.1 cytochrome B [Gammaproteobacteria bacterium]